MSALFLLTIELLGASQNQGSSGNGANVEKLLLYRRIDSCSGHSALERGMQSSSRDTLKGVHRSIFKTTWVLFKT